MSILEEIVEHKRKEVAERKELVPIKLLEQSIYFLTEPMSLNEYLRREDKSGIIAEIKRKSPSNPEINPNVNIERTSIGYMQAGASALSVLTDTKFFGGKNEDLTTARKFNFCPILRKDFIVDEYQIIEAKSIGADAILIIATAIPQKDILNLSAFARTLGLEVLLEMHNEKELKDELLKNVSVIGVNNRNLKTMEVSLEQSKNLAELIPENFTKISESGIRTAKDVADLKAYGFNGFLIGELFMKCTRPERTCMKFIEDLKELTLETNVLKN